METVKLVALSISFTVFAFFLFASYFKVGLTKSVSQIFYKIEEPIWFSLMLWITAIPMFAFYQEGHWLIPIGVFCIAMVGGLPLYKKYPIIHYIFAGVGIFSMLIGIWEQFGMLYPFVGYIAGGIPIILTKLWWKLYLMEILAFLIIIVSLAFTVW